MGLRALHLPSLIVLSLLRLGCGSTAIIELSDHCWWIGHHICTPRAKVHGFKAPHYSQQPGPHVMGLFNRKSTSRIKTNGESSNLTNSAGSLKSPPPNSSTNGFSFNPASMADITLPGPPDPALDPAAYLRSIYAVRQRSRFIIVNAKRNQLSHFDVDFGKWKETAAYVVSIIKVCQLCTRWLRKWN